MPKLLDRYLAGDHIAVWKELVALGPRVRHKRYYDDAAAVAAETMRRARYNVELLIQRLDGKGFVFLSQEVSNRNHCEAVHRLQQLHAQATRNIEWTEFGDSPEGRKAVEQAAGHSRTMALQFIGKTLPDRPAPLMNPAVLDRPGGRTAKDLDKLEKIIGGPLPLSLRAWYEQVGGLSLLGWHSTFSPNADEPWGITGTCPDPLMLWPLSVVLMLVEDERARWGPQDETNLYVAVDDVFKAGAGGGDGYWITVPNPCADALFQDTRKRTFVNYLRNCFKWGGFPGWGRAKIRPGEELAALKEGLLPL